MLVRALGIATLALFFLAAFTPLPGVLYDGLRVPDRIERADAIVVLGGGGVLPGGQLTDTSLRRTMRGIALYHDGLAPLLVLSGAPGRRSEAAARVLVAARCRVPATATLALVSGYTTRDEVRGMRTLLQARGVTRVLLVTDGAHMRRAQQLVRDAGFEALAAPVHEVERTSQPEPRLRLLRATLREALALVYYHLAGYL